MMRAMVGLLICWLLLVPVEAGANIFGSAGGGGGAQCLVYETFDAAGYDKSWTESAGTPDEDYTSSPAPLAGTQSFYLAACANSTTQKAYIDFTPTSGQPQEGYFLYRLVNAPTTTGSRIIGLLRTGASTRATVSLETSSGPVYKLSIQVVGGTKQTTTGTLSTGTTYHLWPHYLKGTGSTAVATIAFSTDGVRPTSGNNYKESTAGNGTTDADRFELMSEYVTGTNCVNALVDKVIVDDGTISDNPTCN